MRRRLWTGYFLLISLLILVTLEVAARWVGLGTPVLYYNAAWSAQPEPPQALRVLFIGDSVTWGGSRVADAALFSEVAADVLRAQGRPVYSMNAGVNGTSLVNHAEIFWHKIESTDVVVWLFPWGDVLRAYSAGGSLWPARFQPQFALVEVVDNILFLYWTNMFRERSKSVGTEFAPFAVPPNYQVFFANELKERKKKNLKAFRSVLAGARLREIPVIIGVTPKVEDGRLISLEEEANAILQDAAALGAYVMDVSAILSKSNEEVPTFFVDSVHFSASGHRVVGKALGQTIAEAVRNALMAEEGNDAITSTTGRKP